MKVFFDTNVFLDVSLNRPGKAFGEAIFQLFNKYKQWEAWMAWHTLSNGFYIVQRTTKSIAQAQKFAADLLIWVNVAATGTAEAKRAEQMRMTDMEDAMQIVAAEACGADVIITSNVADFTLSPIPVFSPRGFLENLGAVPK